MAFIRTTAINKLLGMTKRKKVVQGSTSAGKTYGIIPILIDRAAKRKTKILVVAETLPSVKSGAVRIFLEVMEETGRWVESRWNASSLTYTFANKSYITFKSFDTEGKAKAAGKWDILFLNEANHIPYVIADLLMTRATREIWIDFNPDHRFWAHDIVETEANSEFLRLTYLDNEACPAEIVEELEMKQRKAFHDPSKSWDEESNIRNAYWANWCRVYVRGLTGKLQGTILTDWETVNAIPPEAVLLGYGTDFGKGGDDPTTTTAVYYYDGLMYWDNLIYQSELLDHQHARKLKEANVSPIHINACDNSEPSKIRELTRRGFPKSVGFKKETIEYGIGLLQRYPFRVTSRSVHAIEELGKWKYDKHGDPIDKWNHIIDGVRYLYVALLSVSQQPKKRGGLKTR